MVCWRTGAGPAGMVCAHFEEFAVIVQMNVPENVETAGVRVYVCRVEELPVGLGRAFDIDGRQVALFRTRKGRIFAVENRCPHKGGPLAEGMLAGDAVVCPLHAFRYELAGGACDQPGACPVKAYAVIQQGEDVYVEIPLPSPAQQ